ncbi:MAG: L7Ae/L30e/S12e/Gadd45 family ribosomal protein [Anaerostipes sp.]|uniref:L7Ae/L30e/S12e/Gadd45 family ribosomal protein n=1 Tax=Anaerostipes sp. TaxID=1872530 RepID=UPI0039942A50
MRLNKKVLSLLGLAMRSGNLVSGEFAVQEAIRGKNAGLVIIAEDASDNTKKMFQNQCNHYQVPLYHFCQKEELGHAIGKEFRASIAVTDQGFCKALLRQLDKE